jgi:undecaprenyl-diphosphatase
MLTFTQAAVLGLLQGVTELFPISSLGHSVLVPQLLGWHIDQATPQFVAFVTATHLATAFVLLGFFWSEWVLIVGGIFRSLYRREVSEEDSYAKLGWLLVVGTIPAGLIGILFQSQLVTLFAAGLVVAIALCLNGVMLFVADALRKRSAVTVPHEQALANLTYFQAAFIGVAQSIALVPGLSRTGAAMTGGLISGLSHENAARFSFLLATPIIFAAGVLNIPDLFSAGSAYLGATAVGFICAGAAAYVSVRFLTRYFKTRTLLPFAAYCVIAGLVSLAFLVR